MKTQMKAQKILTLVSLIFAAVTLVYAFFFVSGMLYEVKFWTGIDAYAGGDAEEVYFNGADELYNYTQNINNALVIMSIVLIVCVVFIYITNTNKRRNYYITNYIAIGILVAFALAYAIFMLVVAIHTLTLCGNVDVQTWLMKINKKKNNGRYVYALNREHYSDNIAMPVLGIFVSILSLAMVAAWVLNTLWKIKLMRGEKELLANGMVKEVA